MIIEWMFAVSKTLYLNWKKFKYNNSINTQDSNIISAYYTDVSFLTPSN